MGRPNRSAERRAALLPVLAEAFAGAGYRGATTAQLATRCGVQETVLYRLWPDKRAMFLAAIDHVYERSLAIWDRLAAAVDEGACGAGRPSAAERILAHEARHHGDFKLYRVLFAGLGDVDDDEVRAHMRATYRKFQRYVRDRIVEHRVCAGRTGGLDPELAAWAVVGLGTVVNIGREVGLINARERGRLLADAGRVLLEGEP